METAFQAVSALNPTVQAEYFRSISRNSGFAELNG